MGTTRRIVHDTWGATGADRLSAQVQIDLALAQLAQPYCEDKLVGILALSERLLDHLAIEHVPQLARVFEQGHIEDWSTCDWYCVKVLGRFVAKGADRRERAEATVCERNVGDPARFSQTSVGWLLR